MSIAMREKTDGSEFGIGAVPSGRVGFAVPAGLRYRFCLAGGPTSRIEAFDALGQVSGVESLADHLSSIPCFTPDCMIETESGPQCAGDLRPGDRVVTRDNGLVPVRWIGSRRFDWRMLGLNPLLRPVRIAVGAFGGGNPSQAMTVSPNHGIVVSSRAEKDVTSRRETLSQARDLVGMAGVSRPVCREVLYLQILCERHELLMVSGVWCESFRPTVAARAALEPDQRHGLDDALAQMGVSASDYLAALPTAGVPSGIGDSA